MEPKTRKSKAPIPVISQLAERLNLHRSTFGNPATGPMFVSPIGRPVNLDALARDHIAPTLAKVGLQWRGWHAFRRGLATNLDRLGVPDTTIQRILRHANINATRRYIKSVEGDVAAAMLSFEAFLKNAPNMHLGQIQKPN